MNPLALLPSYTPPAAGSSRTHMGQIITPFDLGLSGADLSALRMALRSEMNPNHLTGFASTLAADHPVSASLLYARGALLEQRPRVKQEELVKDGSHAAERLRELVDRATNRRWSGANAIRWISEVPLDVGKNLAALVQLETGEKWPDVCEGLQRVSPRAMSWPRLDRLATAAEGVRAFERAPSMLHYESALALAQPVPPVMRGQYPTAASLQAFGFHELYPRTRGADVLARATDFAHAVALADRLGIAPWVALLLQRRAELDTLVYGGGLTLDQAERETRRAASDLVVNPQANLDDVPIEVVVLARSLVIEIGPDLRVVDPIAGRIALRPVAPAAREPDAPDRHLWTSTYNKDAHVAAIRTSEGSSCST